jgi:Ig-fold domain
VSQDGEFVSRVTPFVAIRHLELRKPGLKVQSDVEGQTLCMELSIDGIYAVFSDNYFDVSAGTTVTVSIPLPENWTTGSHFQARSLYDSFA